MKIESFNEHFVRGKPAARLWLGEMPALQYPCADVWRWETVARGVIKDFRQAAMERQWALHTSCYGLLGGTFQPEDGGTLQIEIGVSAGYRGQAWPLPFPSVALYGTPVVGLPAEFAEGVRKGVEASPELARFGAGILRIDRAAHTEICSTNMAFQRVARIVMRLLTWASLDMSKEAILSLLLDPA